MDQLGDIIWQKTYGTTFYEFVSSIGPTFDGGYIISATADVTPSEDFWIIKLDDDGNILWQKSYGGSNSEIVASIQQTKDGGFIVAGTTISFGAGGSDIWVLKLDSQGNIIWQNSYGTSEYETAYSIALTKQGGCIITGTGPGQSPTVDAIALRLDSKGNLLWSKSYGSSGSDTAYSIDSGGGTFTLIGQTDSVNNTAIDFWAMKLNRRGKILWQRAYGGLGVDSGLSIKRTRDGGYIFAGHTLSASTDWNISVVKLDSNGNALWQNVYGGSGSEEAYSITSTTDHGYAVAGWSDSFGAGLADMWILKLDSNGDASDSCVFESKVSLIETTPMMNTSNLSLTVSPTSVIPNDTTVAALDTNAQINVQCSN